MKKFIATFGLVFFTLLALFLPGLLKHQAFVLGGSTSVYNIWEKAPVLLKQLGLPFQVYYNSIGSHAAIKSVHDEVFDIGYASFDVKLEPSQATKIAKHLLAIDYLLMVYRLPNGCKLKPAATHKALFVPQIVIRQLFKSQFPLWKTLSKFLSINYNCTADALKKKIIRINRENGSGTRTSFENFFALKKIYYFEQQMKSTNQLVKTLLLQPGTISYISLSYAKAAFVNRNQNPHLGVFILNEDQSLKALFAHSENNNALLTALNRYKFKRKFVGLYLKRNRRKLAPLFKFIQTPDFTKILQTQRLAGPKNA